MQKNKRSILSDFIFLFIFFLGFIIALIQNSRDYDQPVVKGKVLHIYYLPTVIRGCTFPGSDYQAYKIIMGYSYQVNDKTYTGSSSVKKCGTKKLFTSFKEGMDVDIVYNPKKVTDSHILHSKNSNRPFSFLPSSYNLLSWFIK